MAEWNRFIKDVRGKDKAKPMSSEIFGWRRTKVGRFSCLLVEAEFDESTKKLKQLIFKCETSGTHTLDKEDAFALGCFLKQLELEP